MPSEAYEELRRRTCCFTGHRPEKLRWKDDESHPDCVALKKRIAETLEDVYKRGFRHFISGMAQGCDFYFTEAALALREKYPDVMVEAAIPCPTQAKSWGSEEQTRYRGLVDRCDLETVVQNHYTKGCMLRRDRYMVERSTLLIAAYNGSSGGTRYTMNYAMDHGVEVIRLNV